MIFVIYLGLNISEYILRMKTKKIKHEKLTWPEGCGELSVGRSMQRVDALPIVFTLYPVV